jgi:PAS domain S-box-containing protein
VLLERGVADKEGVVRLALVELTGLERAQAALRAVFDTVADAILTIGPSGKIEACNAAASRLFMKPTALLVGLPAERLVPGIFRVEHERRAELVALRCDGHRFPAEVALAPLRGAEHTRLVAVISDISERKQRAAELEEALGRFRELAAHLEEVIYVIEVPTGKVQYVSPAFEKMFGCSASEASEETWPHLRSVHQDDRERVFRTIETVFALGGPLDIQFRIVRPGGAVRTIRSRGFKVKE